MVRSDFGKAWWAAVAVIAILFVGVLSGFSGAHKPAQEMAPAVRVPSNVAWTDDTLSLIAGGDALHGLMLARRCNHCHGEEGFSSVAEIPNLAGMDRLSLWKQLEDFRAGKRVSPIMQPIAVSLSPNDAADLAAYFSMMPTTADPQDQRAFPAAKPPVPELSNAVGLAILGNAQRGIPPCQACHGPVGYVKGAPLLAAQNGAYLLRQLEAFAEGPRANDINLRMRSIAHQLTPDERKAVSDYYGAGMGPGASGR